eukprot:m.150824 g.150824  ORF g.150824 m.150824 type:complete len:299 (-) comp30744_c0_seq1:278-1174(-)
MSSPVESMLKVAEPEERILFGVPKKGRVHKKVLEILEGAGLHYTRPERLDLAHCTRAPVTLVFLPAADISRYVSEGDVDLGITGLDIVRENESDVEIVEHLDLGRCKLVLQGPVGKYTSPEQLLGKRIATSFPNLTKKFFEPYERTGDDVTVTYCSGSVEVACALGLADAVVDLVETGTTMRAAGLEVIHKIMDTEFVLIKNKHTKHDSLVNTIHKRVLGYLTAQQNSMLTYNLEKSKLELAKQIAPGKEGPTISNLLDPEFCAVTVLVPTKNVSDTMDRLQEIGATSLVVFKIDNCR